MEHAVNLPAEQVSLPEKSIWRSVPAAGIVAGLGLLLVSFFVLGRGENEQTLLYSYVFGYLYFLSIALGGLFFVILHHLTRAGWSVVVRRLAECIASTMPLFVALFIPIWLKRAEIFYWLIADDELIRHKQSYLNTGFFTVRAIIYFAVWGGLAWYYARASRLQDDSGDVEHTRKMQKWSALGMVAFALTLNYAAVDWIMSLDPHWFSTIFGVYYFSGCFVAVLATLILVVLQLQSAGALHNVVTWEHFHDMGKLLFAFTVFWAYIGFSQFMLIWYGNLPEETSWYDHRWLPEGWKTVSIVLAAGHFALPFLFLLFADHKRKRWSMALASLWMLTFHMIDIYWLVMPNMALLDHEKYHDFHPSLLNVTCFLGIGALFLAFFAAQLKGSALVPVKDPRLSESLAFENM